MTNLELAKEQGKQAAPNVIDAAKTGEIHTDITLAEQQGNQAGLLLAENFKGTELYERMKEQGNKAIPLIVDGFNSGAGDAEPLQYGVIVPQFVSSDDVFYPSYTQDQDTPGKYVHLDFYTRVAKGYKAIDLSDHRIFLSIDLPRGDSGYYNQQYNGLTQRPTDESIMPEPHQVFYTIDTTRLETEEAVAQASSTFGITFGVGDRLSHITFLAYVSVISNGNSIFMLLGRHTDDMQSIYTYFCTHFYQNVVPTERGIVPDITGHGHLKDSFGNLYETNPCVLTAYRTAYMLILTEGTISGSYGYQGMNIFLDCDTLSINTHPSVNTYLGYYVDSTLQSWVSAQNKQAYMLIINDLPAVYTGEHTITVRALTSKGIEVGVAPLIFA